MVKQQRESFRVEFPRNYYPTLLISDNKCDVFDASEFGVKFYRNKKSQYSVGDNITAIITFPDGEQFTLKASVVRTEELYISIELLTPLPLRKIRAEHLYLIQSFSEKKPFQ